MIGWNGWKRGDICVAREVNGRWCVLRIAEQQNYREWSGCFSVVYPKTTESKTLDKSVIV